MRDEALPPPYQTSPLSAVPVEILIGSFFLLFLVIGLMFLKVVIGSRSNNQIFELEMGNMIPMDTS
ncbi:unnamed protein product [Caenorhabditis brenneri]